MLGVRVEEHHHATGLERSTRRRGEYEATALPACSVHPRRTCWQTEWRGDEDSGMDIAVTRRGRNIWSLADLLGRPLGRGARKAVHYRARRARAGANGAGQLRCA